MRRSKTHFSAYFIWLSCLLGACSQSDSPPMPIYLHFDNPTIRIDASSDFNSSLGIKDIWLDYGPDQLAAFRVPAIIPLIPLAGRDSIFIRGGIFETGLSSTRIPYPFWQPNKFSIANTAPLDTLRIEPFFTYFPRDSVLAYPFEEGFENASMSLEPLKTGLNTTRITRSTQEAFEGNASGRIQFSASAYDFEYAASDFIRLPQSGSNDIYVEVTYKNDIAFTLGFYFAISQQIDQIETGIYFNSGLEWNTVYVHVNDQIRAVPSGAQFKMFFRANSFNQGTGAGNPGNIFLDNVRIIHFN